VDSKRACELTKWNDANHLEILALAYATSGDFDTAVKWQKKAMTDTDYMKKCGTEARKRLKAYKARQRVY
jgi:hypothetical protein